MNADKQRFNLYASNCVFLSIISPDISLRKAKVISLAWFVIAQDPQDTNRFIFQPFQAVLGKFLLVCI